MVHSPLPHNLDITVRTSGTPLTEYHDESATDSSESIVRYVECRDDESFEIAINVKAGTMFESGALKCVCYVDGTWTETPLFFPDVVSRGHDIRVIEGLRDGQSTCRPFRFRSLVHESDQSAAQDRADRVKDLGKIQLIWSHCRVTGNSHHKRRMAQEIISVHEKDIKGKGLSHATKFDKSKPCMGMTFYSSEPVGKPFLTITFYYRSMASLKVAGIVPRTPSPEPLADRAIDTMSADDIREMQAQLKLLQAQAGSQKRIKREGDHLEGGPTKHARPATSGTVFELNEDDSWIEKPATKKDAPASVKIEVD